MGFPGKACQASSVCQIELSLLLATNETRRSPGTHLLSCRVSQPPSLNFQRQIRIGDTVPPKTCRRSFTAPYVYPSQKRSLGRQRSPPGRRQSLRAHCTCARTLPKQSTAKRVEEEAAAVVVAAETTTCQTQTRSPNRRRRTLAAAAPAVARRKSVRRSRPPPSRPARNRR